LLLRLEHDSTSIKVQSRKQAVQSDLQAKRDLIKQLNQRLAELNQLDDSEDEDDVSDTDEEEDYGRRSSYAPALRTASSGIDTVHGVQDSPELNLAAENLTSTLRARNAKAAESSQNKASTTSSSLFPPNTSGPAASSANTPDSSATQTHNLAEHEAIADSLVAMAKALKASASQFGQSLEGADKEILDQAMGALDKNQLGMESAGRRMGALKKMTEGKGWFGRLSLWAKVIVAWFAAVFLVFVLPKLRF
jgi:hypothetical protein